MKHVEFTYAGGFETTVTVPDDQPLRAIIESVLKQVKPGRPNYKDTAVRVLINGKLIPEGDYDRVPSNTDFVKVQEIRASTRPIPLGATGATALFKQTLQDLHDLWNTLICPIGRFFRWPWGRFMKGLKQNPPDPVKVAIIVMVGITLQILAVISVFEQSWDKLLALMLLYCIVTRLQYKLEKEEKKGA